jgi:membrane associated rhomboid family serine protease
MTLQTYGNKICQSDNTMCSQAFISLSWGGQYNKIVNPQLWRLITAGFHHQNFLHIIGNTFIILIVSWYIEPKYGSKRLWTVFLLSIFGGNILSWCVYPQELIIIGASGGCYGLLVLLIADCVLNWETVTYRWHILWFSLAFIGQILYDLFAVGNVAVFAHLGGGLGSFFVSIMILPNFYYKPWEKYLTIVCAILCSIQYIVLPAIRYHYVFVE